MSSIIQKSRFMRTIPRIVYVGSQIAPPATLKYPHIEKTLSVVRVFPNCFAHHSTTSVIGGKQPQNPPRANVHHQSAVIDQRNRRNNVKPIYEQVEGNSNPGKGEFDYALVDNAIKQATKWASIPTSHEFVSKLAGDTKSVEFVMKFTDWVMRTESPRVAASLMTRLLDATPRLPKFMSSLDRTLVWLGGIFAPVLPSIVVNSARLRMRSIVSPFVGDVETIDFNDGIAKNVNLLGEAVLGDREAFRRRKEAEDLLKRPGIDYVSVKVSGVTSQLKKWDFEGSLERVLQSLRPLFTCAAESNPRVLINLDMEEYHDLELTIAAFKKILSEPQFRDLDAGIVIQAYLPDALPELQHLVHWANNERPGNGQIKIRLVKGANLAMEKVEAAITGWEQAPYTSKLDTDANYLCCIDWLFTTENLRRVRVGVASHNLFTLAYADSLSKERGVTDRIGFEQLNGMTPSYTSAISKEGHNMLLYAPVCHASDFDNSIAYLFRRFEESSSEGNFLRSLPSLNPTSETFQMEERRFRDAFEKKDTVSVGPRRVQQRPAVASHMTLTAMKEGHREFVNEPDSDPVLPNVREWALQVLDPSKFKPVSDDSWVNGIDEMSHVIKRARQAAERWSNETTPSERRAILAAVADEIARRRGDFINAMVYEGSKTFVEADLEISEAIDFPNYYGMLAEELPHNFEKFGVVTVAAPWNFPSAIGGGGAFSSLAAGNAVILKPSPNTPRCLELIAECAWKAGVPRDVMQFVQCPEDEVGKHLITESDAVILTGATDTAELFRSWKSDMRLFAETSGKNATVISPAADLDLAVLDLVNSAFSNSGQKCSASSLAICIGDVYTSERFRRQLKDALGSTEVGPSYNLSTTMGPLIAKPDEKLMRALTTLEDGEEWLVEPKCLDADGEGRLWTPGVRMNVKPGSWFHETEVFGPVLGLMQADDLDHALELQNSTKYGLTGGLQSLDSDEIKYWSDRVQVGNVYINRGTTGAIVQRQSFGGWKASVVGPGAKAGGPNYVAQLGTIRDDEYSSKRDETWLELSKLSDQREWETRFSAERDPSQLFCEANVSKYRPLERIAVRIGPNADSFEVDRVKAAIDRCGVPIVAWSSPEEEDADLFANKLADLNIERIRVIGDVESPILDMAGKHNIHVASAPVVMNGRYELLHYLREQAVSRTLHRFGNLVTA